MKDLIAIAAAVDEETEIRFESLDAIDDIGRGKFQDPTAGPAQ